MAKKKDKVPPPGKKGEPSTKFYTRKKWRALLAQNPFEVCGKELNPRGGLIVGTALMKNRVITHCDLSNNCLGDDGAIAISEMLRVNSVMQHLNLSQNGIGDVGGIALASAFIPNVTASGQPGQWNRTLFTLTLLGNELGDDTLLAMSNAAACHRDLTTVDMSWNHVGPQGTKCMLRCFQRNNLCNFILAANEIGDGGTELLAEALIRYGGKGQTTINLYRNDVSHSGAAAIGAVVATMDTIQEVNLSGNTLGYRGCWELRNALVPPEGTEGGGLDGAGGNNNNSSNAGSGNYPPAGGTSFSSPPGSPSLPALAGTVSGSSAKGKTSTTSANNISSNSNNNNNETEGAKSSLCAAVAAAAAGKGRASVCGLRMLNISDNVIGDQGAEEIAQIIEADLPFLERLDLADNSLTDKGACRVLQALMHNTKLHLVDLSGNRFGPRAAEAAVRLIHTSKSLKALNLVHCVASAEQRRNITMAVGESDGLHAELGPDDTAAEEGGGDGLASSMAAAAADEEKLAYKLGQHLQTLAEQEAQRAAEAKAKKKGKKKKKS